MALVIAIAFELIIAVQSIVFIVAPFAGILIGGYANQRSARWRPRRRVFANASTPAIVTGIALALMYALLRLVFIYADTGYPDFNRTDANGQPTGSSARPAPTAPTSATWPPDAATSSPRPASPTAPRSAASCCASRPRAR